MTDTAIAGKHGFDGSCDMRRRKIASLTKQLSKLEKLQFN